MGQGLATGPGAVHGDPTVGVVGIVGQRGVQVHKRVLAQLRRPVSITLNVEGDVLSQVGQGAMDGGGGPDGGWVVRESPRLDRDHVAAGVLVSPGLIHVPRRGRNAEPARTQ